MYCSNCGKEINENSKYCVHCGKEVLNKLRNNQVDSTSKVQIQRQERYRNENLSKPEIAVKVVHDENSNLGLNMEYAVHSNKSYIGYAWLTIVLYVFAFWLGGFIANIVYLNAAKNTSRIIKRDPPGLIFLVVLLIFGIIGLIGLFIVIVIPLLFSCAALVSSY